MHAVCPLFQDGFSWGIRAGGKFGELKGSLGKAEGHEGSLKQNFHSNLRLRVPSPGSF